MRAFKALSSLIVDAHQCFKMRLFKKQFQCIDEVSQFYGLDAQSLEIYQIMPPVSYFFMLIRKMVAWFRFLFNLQVQVDDPAFLSFYLKLAYVMRCLKQEGNVDERLSNAMSTLLGLFYHRYTSYLAMQLEKNKGNVRWATHLNKINAHYVDYCNALPDASSCHATKVSHSTPLMMLSHQRPSLQRSQNKQIEKCVSSKPESDYARHVREKKEEQVKITSILARTSFLNQLERSVIQRKQSEKEQVLQEQHFHRCSRFLKKQITQKILFSKEKQEKLKVALNVILDDAKDIFELDQNAVDVLFAAVIEDPFFERVKTIMEDQRDTRLPRVDFLHERDYS